MLREITERKQIEDTLADSEAELRALFASMQDVVMVLITRGFTARSPRPIPTCCISRLMNCSAKI
jgi:PAS domain-containing protein